MYVPKKRSFDGNNDPPNDARRIVPALPVICPKPAPPTDDQTSEDDRGALPADWLAAHTEVVFGAETNTRVLVGDSPLDNTIHVAARGTADAADVLTDLSFDLVKSRFGAPGRVHAGFAAAASSVVADVVEAVYARAQASGAQPEPAPMMNFDQLSTTELQALIRRRGGDAQGCGERESLVAVATALCSTDDSLAPIKRRDVVCSGHSLGGALALLLAVELAARREELQLGSVAAVTFGAPHVGDGAFAAAAERLLSECGAAGESGGLLRCVMRSDPVPRLLGLHQAYLDYRHVGPAVELEVPSSAQCIRRARASARRGAQRGEGRGTRAGRVGARAQAG